MYLLNKIRRKFFPRTLPAPSRTEAALIGRLREQISSLPGLVIPDNVSAAEKAWLQFRAEMRAALLKEDPRDFLRFDVIRQTMFVDHPTYIRTEYYHLRRLPRWKTRWRDAIDESDRLLVPRCPYYWRSSGNMIHYAFHLAQFERHTGVRISDVHSVLEFGGGYGGMCRLLYRLGHLHSYTILDLPECSALQQFFLGINGIQVGGIEDENDGFKVRCVSDGSSALSEAIADTEADLFIATWSISETPIDFRTTLLDQPNVRYMLIGYQEKFTNIDNARFFREWSESRKNWRWTHVRCEHMPGSQYYLFGVRG